MTLVIIQRRRQTSGHQKGGVAIEFAALFLLFFTLLYGVIAYSVPMVLTLTFKHLSAEAARSTVRVDPNTDPSSYKALISQQVTQVIVASWLPDNWYDGNCPPPMGESTWQALPAYGDNPSFGYITEQEITTGQLRYLLQVCIQRKYNESGSDREKAIIPILQIGGLSIPSLPEIDGERIIRGKTLIQL